MKAVYVVSIACLAVVLGASGLVLSYFQRYQEEHDPKLKAEIEEMRVNDQLDAITVAFQEKMSSQRRYFQQPEILAICISQREHVLPDEVFARLFERLKRVVPKIQMYSYCESLDERERRSFFIYWLDSFEQQSNADAAVGVGFRDNIGGIYRDGMVFNMKKLNGKWTITILGPSWMS